MRPARAANGYRFHDPAAEHTVRQIRGPLDSGLTTGIIRRVLPFLDRPDGVLMHPDCLDRETADLLRGEADRLQQRIDCLSGNRDAILAYLTAVRARQERERRLPGLRSPPPGAD